MSNKFVNKVVRLILVVIDINVIFHERIFMLHQQKLF